MSRSKLGVGCVLAVVLAVALSSPVAEACLMADRLRAVAPHLTEEQVMSLAHDQHAREVIPYELAAAEACVGGMADIFPCDGIDLLAHLSPGDMGGGSGNDLWGWTDPLTGTEYALMGLTNGTAFVDLSDPENPIYLGRLPSHNNEVSSWRDIAVYQDHAFIVADFVSTHGLQVFDLTQLRNVTNPPVTFTATTRYTEFTSAHNIALNEDSGFAYVVGGNTCSGGLHIVDVRDPLNPVEAGCFSGDGYTHDVQCVNYSGPDAEHQGKEICLASNEDTLTVVDVTLKSSPVMLSRTGFAGSGYVHQGWLTEDQSYFVLDDEADESFNGHNTRTYTFDVSDLDAPTLAGFWDAAGSAIDHNQFVRGDLVYQANYTRGLRVLRIDDPSQGDLTEVAFFDTVPSGDFIGFSGAWSTYPYFASGVVLISDIGRGLFIVRLNLVDGELFSDDFETGDISRWSGESAR